MELERHDFKQNSIGLKQRTCTVVDFENLLELRIFYGSA